MTVGSLHSLPNDILNGMKPNVYCVNNVHQSMAIMSSRNWVVTWADNCHKILTRNYYKVSSELTNVSVLETESEYCKELKNRQILHYAGSHFFLNLHSLFLAVFCFWVPWILHCGILFCGIFCSCFFFLICSCICVPSSNVTTGTCVCMCMLIIKADIKCLLQCFQPYTLRQGSRSSMASLAR